MAHGPDQATTHGVRVFSADHHDVPLPPGHRFPMGKYRALRERLVADGLVAAASIEASPLATIDELRLVHDARYVGALFTGTLPASAITRLGFPWSWELVLRSRAVVVRKQCSLPQRPSPLALLMRPSPLAVLLAAGSLHQEAIRPMFPCLLVNLLSASARVLTALTKTLPTLTT